MSSKAYQFHAVCLLEKVKEPQPINCSLVTLEPRNTQCDAGANRDEYTLRSRPSRRGALQQIDCHIERFYNVVCVVQCNPVIEDIDGDGKPF